MRRYIKSFFVLLLVWLSMSSLAYGKEISVYIDGQKLPLSTPATLRNDRTLVPMRDIMEELGYTVIWNGQNQTIEATKDNTAILLTIDSTSVKVNNRTQTLDASPILYNDTTMVPLRFLAECCDYLVTWDQAQQEVRISTDTKDVALLKDSIVYIQTNKLQGSGIILSSDGLIATNFHVLEHASTAQIVFSDGEVYQGNLEVVGLNPESDIALFRIEKTGLTPVKTSTSLKTGEQVTTIGSPKGQMNMITSGEISGFDQDIISTTASIKHGSSGGAVFNENGEAIGMSSGFSDNHYFAIPISLVLNTPQNLNIPIREMASYPYSPTAPKNLRYRIDDEFAYVSWSPVYGAEYYHVYFADTATSTFRMMNNTTLEGSEWLWGFPHSFGLSTNAQRTAYIKITAVVDGVETEKSQVLEIKWD